MRKISTAFPVALFLLSFAPAVLAGNQPSRLNSALMKAVETHNVAAAQRLLVKGADPNSRDKTSGMTVLMTAAEFGPEKMVKLLLTHGATVNVVNPVDGDTPLIDSCLRGSVPAVQALLEKGANVNARATKGVLVDSTPLMVAAGLGNSSIVNLLLARGAQVNDAGSGVTALLAAVEAGHTGIVRTLLARDADPNTRDPLGTTALVWAMQTKHKDIAALLQGAGAKK